MLGKIIVGVCCGLVFVDCAVRYGAKLPEDKFFRPNGAPVKITLWSSCWDHTSSGSIRTKINKATGCWGFSHCSIDAGELDVETKEPLIIDATPEKGVHRVARSFYGARDFVEIELPDLIGAETYGAARMLIGSDFDQMEYLGPRRGRSPRHGVVCSTFVWHSLPQSYREQIMGCDDGCWNSIPSPNQLAMAFKVPRNGET